MNKKILFAAIMAIVLVGTFSTKLYINRKSPTEKEYSILTPASDIQLGEDTVIIEEEQIPLNDAPEAVINEHPNVQSIVELVNAERTKAGLPPLTKDPVVCQAAAIRAEAE